VCAVPWWWWLCVQRSILFSGPDGAVL
jgi:hypothetical protein